MFTEKKGDSIVKLIHTLHVVCLTLLNADDVVLQAFAKGKSLSTSLTFFGNMAGAHSTLTGGVLRCYRHRRVLVVKRPFPDSCVLHLRQPFDNRNFENSFPLLFRGQRIVELGMDVGAFLSKYRVQQKVCHHMVKTFASGL